MKPLVSNEQFYELAVQVLHGFDALLTKLEDVQEIAKATNAELAQLRLPMVASPRTDGGLQ
jgi:hypothetical protein